MTSMSPRVLSRFAAAPAPACPNSPLKTGASNFLSLTPSKFLPSSKTDKMLRGILSPPQIITNILEQTVPAGL